MIIEEEVYLEHFGIKGMRWGVRNKHFKKVPRSTDPSTAREVIRSGTRLTTTLLASGVGILAIAMIVGGHQNAVDARDDFSRIHRNESSGSW